MVLLTLKNGIDNCQSRKIASLGQFYFTDESEPSLVIIKAKEQISLLNYILRDFCFFFNRDLKQMTGCFPVG